MCIYIFLIDSVYLIVKHSVIYPATDKMTDGRNGQKLKMERIYINTTFKNFKRCNEYFSLSL